MPDRVPEDQSDTGARAARPEPDDRDTGARAVRSEPDNDAEELAGFENLSGEKIPTPGGRVDPSEDHHGFEHLSGDKAGEPEETQGQTPGGGGDGEGYENLSGTKIDDEGGSRR